MKIVASKAKPSLYVASTATLFSICYALLVDGYWVSKTFVLNSFIVLTITSAVEFCLAFMGGRLVINVLMRQLASQSKITLGVIVSLIIALCISMEELVSKLFQTRIEHDAGLPLSFGILLGSWLAYRSKVLQNSSPK